MFSRRNRTDDLIPSAMKKEGNARGPEGMRQTKIGATRSWLSRNGRPGAERHLLSFFCVYLRLILKPQGCLLGWPDYSRQTK
ncbi:Hypothetical protein NTJ_07441 [Nesidiocoris tenuis]|uniref:Uncharacterized protein n=1 Tax=Nesidiocoris tenuis TaxID=355587 RepID=A0ABN7AQZ7_9HEMI|nr:Hypothetical protein NTJ_07441 [Nesidiocoris tenuis]